MFPKLLPVFAAGVMSIAWVATLRTNAVVEENVAYRSGDITLAATVYKPAGSGRLPAVVFIQGAEGIPRASYKEIAESLTKIGMAVLIPDKRGIGESQGTYVESAPLRQVAEDALAGVKYMRTRNDVDTTRLGVYGVSRGGWAAPLAATLSNTVRFVVAISGPGVSPSDQSIAQRANQLIDDGYDGNGRFDPDSVIRRLRVPVLAVFGARDRYIPMPLSADRFRASLQKSGTRDFQVSIIPGAGHMLQAIADSSSENLRAPMHPQTLVPEFIRVRDAWLTSHLHLDDPSFVSMQERGAKVMGVDQYASTHSFDDFKDGGRIALESNTGEKGAVDAIRLHLQTIAKDFARGDFTNPSLVHSMDVPGAAIMKEKASRIAYRYSASANGGEVRITTKDAAALRAIHEFLAFQREAHHAGMDHGMMTHE